MDDDWTEVEKPENGTLPIRSISSTESKDLAVEFYNRIERGALGRLKASDSPIFKVLLGGQPLYTTFVKNLATSKRQEYSCSTCKLFASRYGDLALVRNDGTLEPLLWSMGDLEGHKELTAVFGKAIKSVMKRFEDQAVTTEFKVTGQNKEIGVGSRGGFSHMHLHFPESRIRKAELPGYTSADTIELATMLQRILDDYKLDVVRKAYLILDENKLPYADNHKASAKWLLELVEEDKIGKGGSLQRRFNLRFRYAASSFIGSLKQMRSGALGTLLQNIKDDVPWQSIQSQWNMICNPLMYMRPQAAPSEGNIKSAERLFEQLGLTNEDLRRRLLVQDDVPEQIVIWASENMKTKQKKTTKASSAVFANVKAKAKGFDSLTPAKVNDEPATKMTFTRFVNKVLPKAKKVDCWLDGNDQIVTCITGLSGTKPIMQWHDDEGKNLASHYLWPHRPRVDRHNLIPKAWNEVRCLIPFPHLWDGTPLTTTFPLEDPDGANGAKYKYYHKQKGFRYLFVLEENHESTFRYLPLFPEYLKSEFHGVRSTIEAFCKTASLEDVPDGKARGGFVGGVEASRGCSDQKLSFRVENFNGEVHKYDLTLFE